MAVTCREDGGRGVRGGQARRRARERGRVDLEQPANGGGRDEVRVGDDLLDEAGGGQRDAIDEGPCAEEGVQQECVDGGPQEIQGLANRSKEGDLRGDPNNVQRYAYRQF